MNFRILLFSIFLLSSVLNAQEPYRNLIISEARMSGQESNHVELTNMGDEPVNLGEFKFGLMRPWIPEPVLDVWNDPWIPEGNRMFMLPDVVLQPGESFVITSAYDFGPTQYNNKVDGFEGSQRLKQIDIYDLADYLIHIKEPKSEIYINVTDSVTTSERFGDNYQWVWETWSGRGCFYIEHHFAEGDSAVVDQVGGVFDDNGKNFSNNGYDVAGVTQATGNSLLVRKYNVKTGNLDFANSRGVGLEDSEWLPVQRPDGYNSWRDLWWTVGNHGNYVLDENTLVSNVIDVDFTNKTLTVPWGVRRLDDIMRHMVKKPGIAWNYNLNPMREDSLYYSARTGDQLTVYVLGNELQTATFDILVADPTTDANLVVPKARVNIGSVREGGPIRTNTQAGIDGIDWPRVTIHDNGLDTITGTWHGIPFAMRTDTLLKYLEKPANSSWEFVFADGYERPDLKNGDKLKIIAQNGAEKEYYIQVRPYGPSHNADLAAITWPDIPDFYRGIFGWIGDTIPNFNSTTYNYRVQVPLDVDGIPALVAKPSNLNAKVDVKGATSLSGTIEDRTVSFVVIAEDDSVTNTYNIEFVKDKDPQKLQPYHAEPFISEYVFWEQWSNVFAEICNPGNQPLDLSNYMIAMQWNTNPAGVIESRMGTDYETWLYRYDKYVPGYKWVDQDQWAITPGILERDLSTNAIVYPGDVFCLGSIHQDVQTQPAWMPDFKWWVPEQLDIQFNNFTRLETYSNPWNEPIHQYGSPIRNPLNGSLYLFKILNDSIQRGLKPANDPADFELLETWSMADGSNWIIGGKEVEMVTNWIRKPEIYKGNPEFEGSFGTNWDDSEWRMTNWAYWQARNVGWPLEILNVASDIGQHFMDEPTHYKSTVTSVVYKVSEGYSMEEEIRGMTTGTTVGTFLSNLNKANENQTLTVKSGDTELGMDDILSMDDVLVVLSADSTNTTQYLLDVSEEGLSSNALLTSTLYEIEVTDEPMKSAIDENTGSGYIAGFEYGTQLRTVLNNVTVPPGASLSIINGEEAYVPLKMLNFDTAYVNVTVNPDTYFNVIAENGITTINYQLQPRASENDAFILSDIYTVMQAQNLVNFVPRGTNVQTLLSNIVPSLGATVKIVDKIGLERTEGSIYEDDKVVVTSPNGSVTRVYHLSMLRTQYILETTYLAYVLSDVYLVDQVNYEITGPSGATLLTEFYARITPSMGATAVVVDANGNEKTSGDLDDGDMLKVTSADGKIVVMYELKLDLTSVELSGVSQIKIYPNPTDGRLNVSGLEQGNRIQVFNANGAMVRDMKVQSSLEVLSLEDQPAGMFLIIISNDNKMLGRYKAIKK
jgi:hypothetical protein